MKLAFHTLDVFTDKPFSGNPLAVFAGAPALTDAQMQTMARELNLSETVFVRPPEQGGLAKLRIFTPGAELPFAGHPTIGTAFLLSWLGVAPVPGSAYGTGAGLRPAPEPDGGLGAAEFRSRRSPHGTGDGLSPAPEPDGGLGAAEFRSRRSVDGGSRRESIPALGPLGSVASLLRPDPGTGDGLRPDPEPVGGLGAEELRSRRSPHGTGDGLRPAPEPDGQIVFEEGVGPIKVRLRGREGVLQFAQLEARATELGPRPPRLPALAAMLGLSEDDLDHPTLGPTFISAGGRFLMVPLRDVDALGRARLQRAEWQRTLADEWSPQVYVVAGDPESPQPLRVRMFGPALGIPEDPATGSAAVALAGLLGVCDPRPEGVLAWTLLQGIEMGRPSRLEIEAVKRGGEVVATRVGGTAVRVSSGEMECPE